jgi:predicted lysophospholipase L1 biosynthesis ABC-type transport system permease subunit
MESKDYLKDISEIKDLMNKSSRFISLSGLSGILAGIYALIGAYLAYDIIYVTQSPTDDYKTIVLYELEIIQLFAIAFIVVLLSIVTGIILSWRKAKKNNESMWDVTSKRLLINFLIPLVTGGVIIIFMIERQIYLYVAPLTLIFYGLALVNASKYTLGYVRYLGLTLIVLGLASAWFLGYGLFFWALGFGVCHIIYGAMMHYKYDRN